MPEFQYILSETEGGRLTYLFTEQTVVGESIRVWELEMALCPHAASIQVVGR